MVANCQHWQGVDCQHWRPDGRHGQGAGSAERGRASGRVVWGEPGPLLGGRALMRSSEGLDGLKGLGETFTFWGWLQNGFSVLACCPHYSTFEKQKC